MNPKPSIQNLQPRAYQSLRFAPSLGIPLTTKLSTLNPKLSTLLCFLLPFFAIGQVSPLSSQELSYNVEMILPQELSEITYINDMIRDPFGNIWLASYNGLSCYNGQNLIHYNNNWTAEDPNERKELFLTDVGTGYVYFNSTDNGLHIWSQDNKDRDIICFNTRSRKVVKSIKRSSTPHTQFLSSEEGGEVYSLSRQDEDSNIIIDCVSCEEERKIDLEIKESIVKYRVHEKEHWILTKKNSIRLDSMGNVLTTLPQKRDRWFTNGTTDILSISYRSLEYTQRWDRDKEQMVDYFKIPNQFLNKSINYFDQGDSIWFTDYNRSVYLWDRKQDVIEDYSTVLNELASELSPNSLRGELQSILPLEDGVILFLTQNSLFIFRPKQLNDKNFFEPIYSAKSITSMRQIAEDEAGNIYASFYTGVAVKKKGSSEFIDFYDTRIAEQTKEATYSLTCVGDEVIWNSSVYNIHTGDVNYVHFDFHGIHVNHVLEQDSLWLFHWYSNEWVKYVIPTKETTLVSENLFALPMLTSKIMQSKDGLFWFANDKGGIQVLDRYGKLQKQYHIRDLKLTREDDFLYDLHIHGDTILYASNIGLGILDTKSGQSVNYTISYAGANASPVPRRVYFIFPDGKNTYFLGTDRGLVHFDAKEIKFKTLTDDHPLANKEFNRNSYLKASDGRYYVGTVDGLYSFLSEELTYERNESEIVQATIYELLVFNERDGSRTSFIKDWDERKEIALKPSDNNIQLKFSVPSKGDEMWYSYKIEGLSSEWSELSKDGFMEIYGLPPGKYTVDLMAKKDPIQATSSILSIQLSKPQIWYKRVWVILLFAATIMGLISLMIRNRYARKLKHELEMQTLRTKISSDLHDDVGSILGGLAIQSDLMAKIIPSKFQAKMKELSGMSREAMELMRDTVWAMDTRKDKFVNLFDRMQVFAEKALGRKDIEYSFYVNEKIGNQAIDPETRQHVYLIFKEAISNIVKHSDGTKVDIAIDLIKGEHLLIIRDNGKSNAELNEGGQGLSNMKMRAQAIGGKLLIRRDEGFEVKLVLKDS